MKKTVVPFLSLLLLAATQSYATTVERLGLEDLVKKAHTIVAGKVTSSRAYWSPDRRLIYTEYTLEVDDSIKGRPGRTISVTTIGGKVGDTEWYVSGMPSFQKGENAVVFVETSGVYQTVVGLGQGKFTITNGEVFNNVGGLSFPDGQPGDAVKMPLASFKARIRTLLNR
jgi:hypothetical protein